MGHVDQLELEAVRVRKEDPRREGGLDITPHTRASSENAAWMPYPPGVTGGNICAFSPHLVRVLCDAGRLVKPLSLLVKF